MRDFTDLPSIYAEVDDNGIIAEKELGRHAHPAGAVPDGCYRNGYEYSGESAGTIYTIDALTCQQECQRRSDCQSFTYYCFGQSCCHMKRAGAVLNTNWYTQQHGYVSGPKWCSLRGQFFG